MNIKLAISIENSIFLDVFWKVVILYLLFRAFRIRKGYFEQYNYLNSKFMFCVIT